MVLTHVLEVSTRWVYLPKKTRSEDHGNLSKVVPRVGSGLRGHSDDQIRSLKPDDRPEMTKENARWETEEEDMLTELNDNEDGSSGQTEALIPARQLLWAMS